MFQSLIDLVGRFNGINLVIFTVLIAAYAFFVWKFYKFLARKNILYLNLTKYNKTTHAFRNKVVHSALFLAEYAIILPVIVLIWFVILGVFLIVLSKEQSIQQILLITAAIVGATRISSYISEPLAKDLAKLLPFTIIVFFIMTPNFFSLTELVPRFLEIPSFFEHIVFYLVVILIIEIILRTGNTIVDLFRS